MFETCTQLRRKFVRRGRINDAGEFEPTVKGWIAEACGYPLSDARRASGTCGACASGWRSARNLPANDETQAAETEAAARLNEQERSSPCD